MDLRSAWQEGAESWIRWARSPELDDDFWQFNLPHFLDLLPPAGLAARLPVRGQAADLVTAFMCLHDIDDMTAAIAEAARVLAPGGRFAIALLHPVFTARLAGAYADEQPYTLTIDRAGQSMTYHGRHRPLTAYTAALGSAGLAVEAIREPVKVSSGRNTMPFLHLLARASAA